MLHQAQRGVFSLLKFGGDSRLPNVGYPIFEFSTRGGSHEGQFMTIMPVIDPRLAGPSGTPRASSRKWRVGSPANWPDYRKS